MRILIVEEKRPVQQYGRSEGISIMLQVGSSGRVLITEDDGGVRAFLSSILSRSGLTPVEAPDGESALALLERSHFDLLLLDIHLPGMDGFEVLRNVKSRAPGLPVVMLTGGASIPAAVQAVKDGADDYLAKPVAPLALLDSIRRCLSQHGVGKRAMLPGIPEPAANVPEPPGKAASGSCSHSAEAGTPSSRTALMHRCPHCASPSIRRSRFRGMEPVVLLLLCLPFRCLSCDRRFWYSSVMETVGGTRRLLKHFLIQRPWGHQH